MTCKLLVAMAFVVLASGCTQPVLQEPGFAPGSGSEKCGVIFRDDVWSGEVHATCQVHVPSGVTLQIEPGTVIRFKHDRNYKTFDRAGLSVQGGAIKALGNPENRILFTSDAQDPVNGDWNGIQLGDCMDCVFDHVIVEFAELGIGQTDSSAVVSNSIIRWSNSEGLYAERSSPTFVNNTLYGNGYHDIAMEQFNTNVRILNNLFRGGHYSIHHEKSDSTIEGNYFKDYQYDAITAGMESNIIVRGNNFENIGQDNVNAYGGSVAVIENSGQEARMPEFDYQVMEENALGYTPGDPDDKFPYIYADEDETRRVVKRIGKGLSFGWALAYAGGYLWRFSLGDGSIGNSLDFIRIDPDTGDYKLFRNDIIMNPRGLDWDGESFWVNDFSLLRVFRFRVAGDGIEILDSFDIPEKELGGLHGLTTDGEFLYFPSRDTDRLLKTDKNGNLLESIQFGHRGLGDSIVWTGNYFWTNGGCSKGLCKWTKNGRLAGEAYPAAKEAWAFAWDGKYLWTIQRTSELWDDPKIYKIEILDDSIF